VARTETTLVDANILLDLVTKDPVWWAWSIDQLDQAPMRGPLWINDIIYAEVSTRFATVEALDDVIDGSGLVIHAVPRPALFLAAKMFQRTRRNGSTRTGVLPDFFTGAHAAVAGVPVLTRDPSRYRRCFPTLSVLAPT
jgi:predicted nucleic acid-binding protein